MHTLLVRVSIANKLFSTMMKYVCLAVVLVAGVLSQEITEECLNCLCQGSTGCDLDYGCVGDVCGPYRISWGYWADGGKPVVEGDDPESIGAYPHCAITLECATRAVKGYMDRYQADCNFDGATDCVDYALLHRFGGFGCYAQTLPDDEWTQRFQECQSA